jgi:hypothetical protein
MGSDVLRRIVTGLALGLVVGACSPAPPPSPTPSPAPTRLALDPCTLLTSADLTSTLTRPATTGTRTTDGVVATCTWEIAPAIVVVTVGPLDSTTFATGFAQGGSVDGIGDRAYFAAVTHELHFAQGGIAVAITVSGVALVNAETDELGLASAVLGHL